MIDTVILTIQRNKIATSGNQWELHSKSKGYEKFVINKNALQKQDGIYRPRVRGIKRVENRIVQVEFSIPKLLYGNNIDEVSEENFEQILYLLKRRLVDFGVYAEIEVLREAAVSACHFSKNIPLREGYTANFVISEINKIKVSKRIDVNKDSFRNNGQSLQIYTNTHSLVFYDKIEELKRPLKRLVDKTQTEKQPELFAQARKNKLEVVRIEMRLSNRKKLIAMMRQFGFAEKPVFRDVFKKDVSQAMLKHYWQETVMRQNTFLFDMASDTKKVLRELLDAYPNLKAKDAIYLTGLNVLSKEGGGIREMRTMLENRASPRTWYRISTDLERLNYPRDKRQLHGWLRQIDEALNAFVAYKIAESEG